MSHRSKQRWVTLPDTVKVGALVYTFVVKAKALILSEDRHAIYGCTDPNGTEIIISPVASVGRQQQTVLHEILHAAWNQAKLPRKHRKDTPLTEELVINRLDAVLLQVIRENPKVIEWLQGEQ